MADPTRSPITLLVSDILEPIDRTHSQLDQIVVAQVAAQNLASEPENARFGVIFNQGLFVHAIASLEVMMQDVQIKLLCHFPEKMGNTDIKSGKVFEKILVEDVLDSQAEKFVRQLMYKDTAGVLESFANITSIDLKSVQRDQIDRLIEMKETRNILLHNGLKVNEAYLHKSGPCCRGRRVGESLSISSVYLAECLVIIKSFVFEIGAAIRTKYGSYTRVAALKRLWDFMVGSPQITPFEEYWDIDVEGDLIRMRENPEYEARMGSSERHFLTMWRDLFVGHGSPSYPTSFSLIGLDSDSRRKVAILLTTAYKCGVLANL